MKHSKLISNIHLFAPFRVVSRAILLSVSTVLLFGTALAQSESPNVPADWTTLAEQTGYRKTWSYDDTVKFAKRLDAASPNVVYTTFGKSGEGRDMPLLIAASGREFTPALARKSGKAIVLVQAGIHAGEIDGKDAGLALFATSP